MLASGAGKSQGKPWVALIVEKALKQIWALAGASSGLATRTITSGCVFGGMIRTSRLSSKKCTKPRSSGLYACLRWGLLLTSAVPVDDVDQLPGILAELELKLTL